MSSNTDTRLDPAAEQAASSEPRLAQQETELATNPKDTGSEPTTSKGEQSGLTKIASNAASSATTVVSGVKDNVFSMFGGGAKKEKKEEPDDDADEPSGSSKAKKGAEGDAEVSLPVYLILMAATY